jgi:septal ring factor EnvC (AmiA/AmiB activator)
MKHLVLILTTFFLLTSCSDKEKEAKLQNRIIELEIQLDECQNGADKIYAKMKLSFEQNDFVACKNYYHEMEKRHPDSELFVDVKNIYDTIITDEKEKAEKEKLLAEKKERERKLKAEKEK